MEIEIRAKIDNIKKIEQDIITLGAKLIKEKKQIDKYFGEICLYEKIGYSFLVRIRTEGNKSFMTYKGAKLKRDGIWEEYELKIDNPQKLEKMFKAMGLEKIIVVKKYRKEYVLNNMTICLDIIENLGSFIEIESLDTKDFDKVKLENLMKILKIKKENIIQKGYVTMLLKKNQSKYSKYIVN